jgi:hypothetical protein
MMGDDTRTLGDMGKLGNGEWNGKDRGSWGTKGEMWGCQRVTCMGWHWKDIGEMARGNWHICSNIAHSVCVNGWTFPNHK